MKIGSLFSGYGGLDLAVSSVLDAEVAWHVEFDRAPSRILDHHWPDVPNYGDVTQCDWASMPAVDIITGGSPCQDLSAAGRRAGMTEGTRSNLWVNMREAIATIRPRYVIWENVLGALSATATSASDMVADAGPLGNPGGGHLRALGRVLGDLAEIGYDARWTTLRASDVGAPHHRARVFLLATPADPEGGGRDYGPATHDGPTDREVNAPRDDHDFAAERGRAVPADTDSVRRSEESGRPSVAVSAEESAPVGDLGALPGDGRADDLLVLPTPVAHPSGNTPENHLRKKPGRAVVTDLSILVENGLLETGGVLPTPTTTQRGTDANLDTRKGARANLHNEVVAMLPTPTTSEATGGKRSGGEYLREIVSVLPTPQASDGTSGGATHPDRRVKEGGHGMSIRDYALLAEEPDRWGKYAPAIRRWEQIVGPAPAPTEPNKNGKPRLNAAFAEWMMGLPEGWVTAPGIGISRAEQLKAIGNGVCPQQAAAALRELFAMPAGEAA
ncbi:DNA cytosine methyltransferase [Gordonia malaquae]|uniref:DNA cytosine methyltransferase n=1 Tax=Gordonia malaquae TaxID=410332 RepID=UPI003015B76D